ncbi:MAG: HAD family hydrolase [Chloroflexota bacterium]
MADFSARRAARPAIIFDFGNVLVDWDPRYLYRKLLDSDEAVERFLREIDFFTWNVAHDGGRDFEESIAELCGQHPQYCDLIRAYNLRYEESIGGAIQPVVQILKQLKTAGYSLYGLSNWPAGKFAQVRPHYPFFDWFEDIVISGEVKLVKPDPRIFELLLQRVGRPAGECLFIDDSLHNITAAQRLGFQTIHYRSPAQLADDLQRLLDSPLPALPGTAA